METHEQAIKRGKKSKQSGAVFEKRVRLDLEEKGWIVDKWTNNVEFETLQITKKDMEENPQLGNERYKEGQKLIATDMFSGKKIGKLVKAKNKWAGPNRPMMMGAGFPDFKCHKKTTSVDSNNNMLYEVIGVESKSNGYLKPEEKQKCQYYLDNHIFSKILIASKQKIKNRIHVKYEEFKNEKE
ncbi:MAG: hypothetical protein ACTSQA_00340 [Candidatus Heimdallarchaeaceae archaeon]